MQACGISISRILTPLLLLATAVAAVDCYVLSTVVPNANQRFREIVTRVAANRAEGEVRPRVFEVDRFPRAVLYVREVAADGWRDVFFADVDRPGEPDVYVAEWGRVAVDSERRTASVALRQGQRHRVDPADPGGYEVHDFDQLTIQLDGSALFPEDGPARGFNELSVNELRDEIAAMRAEGRLAASADHVVAREVLHSRRVRRLRAAGRRAGRQQPQGGDGWPALRSALRSSSRTT